MADIQIDHIIIAVNDLEQAIQDYKDLGFTVVYGGRHASNTTHNALIIFEDGTYLELLAPTGDPPVDSDAVDFRSLIQGGEGFVGYAFNVQDMQESIETIRERGGRVDDPKPGSRITKDGHELHWQTATVKGKLSPFYIQDDTPRLLRVPMQTENLLHPNGAMGIERVTIVIDDLHPGIVRFKALTLETPQVDHDAAYFLLGENMLKIVVAGDHVMTDHLNRYGEVPYTITVRASRGGREGLLPVAQAHGARIILNR